MELTNAIVCCNRKTQRARRHKLCCPGAPHHANDDGRDDDDALQPCRRSPRRLLVSESSATIGLHDRVEDYNTIFFSRVRWITTDDKTILQQAAHSVCATVTASVFRRSPSPYRQRMRDGGDGHAISRSPQSSTTVLRLAQLQHSHDHDYSIE